MKKTLVFAIVVGMLLVVAAMAESITAAPPVPINCATDKFSVIPGLKGFGTDTRAAYGAANPPEICIVDSLLTTTGNPSWDASTYSVGVFKGTLIQCLEGLDTLNGETIDGHVVLPNTGKVILFEVSGTINATSYPYSYYIKYPYTTIVGQTAPSPGINLRNITLICQSHDVLVQHIRVRVGDAKSGTDPSKRDGIVSSTASGACDVVIDHCSMSWGIDENSSVGRHDVTFSNCIIAEALHNSLHSKGSHSKGMNIGVASYNTSLLKNLYIHNDGRNPYYLRASNVFVNNYIYNPGTFNIQLEVTTGVLTASIVGNLIEGGPSTIDSAYQNHLSVKALTTASEIYLYDNKCGKEGEEWYTQSSADDWSHVRWRSLQTDISDDVKVPSALIWPTGLVALDVDDVKTHVLTNAGARPADRDSADQRVVNHAKSNGTQGAIIDSPSDVGVWPILVENTRLLTLPDNPHGDDDGDCYTNLEEWLHKLAAEVEGKKYEEADTTTPKVTFFNINPTTANTNSPITASYKVSDNKALKQVELHRTNDKNGSPDANNWTKIVSGTSASGSFTDSISTAGTYWYGMNVVDEAGNVGLEPSPVKVVVNSGGGSIYYVPTSTTTVDGDTFCGGATCTSADTIIIRGGARGNLLLQDFDGSGAYIHIVNQNINPDSKVEINGVIQLDNCQYVDLRGDNDPNLTYGIKVLNDGIPSASANSVRVKGKSDHIKISYIEVAFDGNSTMSGNGIFVQDGAESSSWIWDTIEIHHNYIHGCIYAGMYLGQNEPYANDNPYIANVSVHDNIIDDSGVYGMVLKGVSASSGVCCKRRSKSAAGGGAE